MKIDKRKNYYLILDTEGLGLNDSKNKIYGQQKSYDIGYVIIDKKGHIQKTYNALTQEIFGDTLLMETAYYANKIPIYNTMIENKEITKKLFYKIINQMKKDLKTYNIKGILAYNVNYDIVALVETAQYTLQNKCPKLTFTKTNKGKLKPQFEKCLQKLLDTKVEFYDIWTMAINTICKQKTFLANAKYTPKGYIQTNAEVVYQYVSDLEEFQEQHTALNDALIESEILTRIFANKGTLQKQEFMAFRKLKRLVD